MQILKYGAVLAAGWLLAAGAAECAFRLMGDQPTLDLQRLYAPFAGTNYKLAPSVDTAAKWSSGELTVHTDELGLRCDEQRRFAVRAGERVDVVLLGDSQGFGNGVTFEDSLAGSTAICAARDGFRVANASVGGHSAASQLQLAEWLRTQHGVNASHYVLLVTPSLAQSGDHLTRAVVGRDGRLYGESPNRLATARVWTKTHLVTYARIRDAARNGGFSAEPARDTPFVFQFYSTGESEDRVKQSFSRFLARMKEFAAAGEAQVQVVYVPLTLEMDFEPIRAAAAAKGIAIDRDAPMRACMAAAREHGLTVISLRPVLERLHATAVPLHLRGDFHYGQQLSREGGSLIWQALKPTLARHEPFVSNQR